MCMISALSMTFGSRLAPGHSPRGRTRSWRRSARAAWAKCIARAVLRHVRPARRKMGYIPLDNLEDDCILFSSLSREIAPMKTTGQSGLVQGTLDMLILKTLALEPMHGWGIGIRLEQISGGVFQVNPGSLFP